MTIPLELAKISVTWPEGAWQWLLYGGGFLAAFILAIVVYVRDAKQLSPIAMVWMLLLRLSVFATLAIIALNPHDKFIKTDFRPSRVLVLVDRSRSMEKGEKSVTAESSENSNNRKRYEAASALFSDTPLIQTLRKNHEVSVLTFNSKLEEDSKQYPFTKPNEIPQDESSSSSADQTFDWLTFFNPGRLQTMAQLKKERNRTVSSNPGNSQKSTASDEKSPLGSGNETRLGDILKNLIDEQKGKTLSAIVVVTDGQWNIGNDPVIANALARKHNIRLVTVGVGGLQHPVNVQLLALRAAEDVIKGNPYDITAVLQGTGMADRTVAVQLLVKPINAPDSELKPIEGDKSVQSVTFRKYSPEEKGFDKDNPDRTKPEEVVFHLPSKDEGSFKYVARVTPTVPIAESNLDDNTLSTDVVIREKNLGVLIIAGGPMREYRFTRNLLHRHEGINLDVWLQSADPGKIDQISQESDDLLTEFPVNFPMRPSIKPGDPTNDKTVAEEYDVVLAFDPDWSSNGFHAESITKLSNWVSRKAGGLIVVAGEVNTLELATSGNDPLMKPILDMYPVVLDQIVKVSAQDNPEPWKIIPTPQGRSAKFMQLGETETESEEIWKEEFEGIYSCYPTTGRKSGAVVYSYFSDPALAADGEVNAPILLASQFYGIGRVIYLGSAEMWRLRSLDEEYYNRFWTKAVWEAGLGHLSRKSSYGQILLDSKEYNLGQSIRVMAQLEDDKNNPLTVPSVTMELIDPNGKFVSPPIQLLAQQNQPGFYAEYFTAKLKGTYKLKVINPAIEHEEGITASVLVKRPERESLDPRQNVKALQDLARDTGGKYFTISDFHQMFANIENARKKIEELKEQNQTGSALRVAEKKLERAEEAVEKLFPNRGEQKTVDERIETLWDARAMMFLLVALLSVEWLTRKLLKLA